MTEDIFFTINPHIKNLSKNKLIIQFNNALKRYYRKELGQRYYKHKDKQYQLSLYPQFGKREIKETHLHLIIKAPSNKFMSFCEFIINEMKALYKGLTFDIQSIKQTPLDYIKVWTYCLREDNEIITNQDLYNMKLH